MSTIRERLDVIGLSKETSNSGVVIQMFDVDILRAFFRDELLKLAEEVEQGKKEHATGFSTATVKRKAHNKTLETVGALIRSKADELK